MVLRLLLVRRAVEIFPLAIFGMALFQYLAFKNGADVHIYWPYPFAPYFALAVGALAAAVAGLARWVLARFRRKDRWGVVPVVALGLLGVLTLAILPDGIEALRTSRATGGRFNDNGIRDFRDLDKLTAIEWLGQKIPKGTLVLFHEGMHTTWSMDWALQRAIKTGPEVPSSPATMDEPYLFADLQFLSSSDQRMLAQNFHVTVLDHYMLVERDVPNAPADGYVFEEREPTTFEWYFLSGADRVRTVRPDPWLTWELRAHYRQSPNPAPTSAPRTPEEVRIAHNMAVGAGDSALAAKYENELLAGLDTHGAAAFTDGTKLLGTRFAPGVEPTLTAYFVATGASSTNFELVVDGFVEAKKPWSLIPADERMRHLGNPFSLPPMSWMKGFIYAARVEVRKRPGREHFYGHMEIASAKQGAPKLANGVQSLDLLVLQ
jgi:hypothetical protein